MKMKNKIIIVVSVILMLGITTVFSFADSENGNVKGNISNYSETYNGSIKETGECGYKVNYTLYDDGTLIIEGNGQMYSNAFNSEEYANTILKVYIKSGVTSIGNYAFNGCSALTSVTIPEGVMSIGNYAFSGCSTLTSVTIPEGVMNIGDYTFKDCRSLTSINLPEGITSIGKWTFRGCSNLTNITIPRGVESIGEFAFSLCSSLTNVTIPNSVVSIGRKAFSACSSLTSVIIPNSIVSIDKGVFSSCSSLTSVTIPNSVVSIGDSAFNYCISLTSVTIPESVTSIGDEAFLSCRNLVHVTINNGMPALGKNVFGYNNSGKSVYLVEIECLGDAPEDYEDRTDCDNIQILYHKGKKGWTSPKWHGIRAMCVEETDFSTLNDSNYNNQGILFTLNESAGTATVGDNSDTSCNSGYMGGRNISAVIPDTVVKDGKTYKVVRIGKNAFSGNNNIPSVTFGEYISSVDVTAFRGCANFKEFKVSDDNMYYSTEHGVLYDKGKMYLYIYPQAIEATSFTVPETVKTIGTYAFAYAENLKNIYVGTNVTSIGENTFYQCSGLESITLPFIGGDAKGTEKACYVFNSKEIYKSDVGEFGDDIYDLSGEKLKNITILAGELPYSAFDGCEYLEKIILPNYDRSSVPYRCFSNCINLKSIQWGNFTVQDGVIEIPENYTSICENAFSGCRSFNRVIINKNIKDIEDGVFKKCINLVEFSVDKENKQYMSDKWGVLYTKDQSTLMYYPTQRIWPYYNVSDKTKTIESNAFYGTSNLVNLLVPNNVIKLNYGSIDNLNGATICVYKDSAADTYCKSNNLTAWYMDNYEMQGIQIYHLPEQTEFDTADDVDFKGLYMARYGGKELQLDDYSIEYDPAATGKQTVTVRSGDYSTSFEITVHSPGKDRTISFDHITGDADSYYVAAYDSKGKLLCAVDADVDNGKATADISYANYTKMSSAKLFAVKAGSMAPAGNALMTEKKSA